MPERPPGPPDPGLPDRVRMPLLTLITQQSLDEDYRIAAERRAAGAPRAPRGRPQRTAAVVIAVFGVLASTAFVQTSRNADVDNAGRETLIARIESQQDRRARQEERVAGLRERVAALDRSVSRVTDEEQALAIDNRRIRVRTGFIAVTGEGVRVSVTEAENADESSRVQDRDLRLLVNGLWEAGAEAIAVNGIRLTAVGAIRTSGTPIEVNGIGIAPPYDVEAVGDTRTLSGRLLDTTTGLDFDANARLYGFDYTVDNVELRLPAASERLLRLRSALIPADGLSGEVADAEVTTRKEGVGP